MTTDNNASNIDTPTILVVDDLELNRQLLSKHLRRQGYQVVEAESGITALDIVDKAVPDLIMLDIMMPEMDGVEVLRRLRATYTSGELPVIMVTALDERSQVVEAIRLGANDYVTKPIDFPILAARTGSQLLRKQAEDKARALNDELEERVLTRTSELRRAYDVLKSESEQRQRTQLLLHESEEKYRMLYDDSPTTFLTVDTTGILKSVNLYGATALGYTAEELLGKRARDILFDADRPVFDSALQSCFACPEKPRTWEVRMRRNDGAVMWARATGKSVTDTDGSLVTLVVCEDITETRDLTEQLTYEASHDSLTNLFNRREFGKRLQRALESIQAGVAEQYAVCYIDLDQFKIVNDSCGHIAGDELLRQLGSVLEDKLRPGDVLARLGGDEYGVLLKNCPIDDAAAFANSLLESIAAYRFNWDDKQYSVAASIGVVGLCDGNRSIEYILAAADSSCYAAKDLGRNRVHVFDPANEDLAQRHGEMQWVVKLKAALDTDRLRLFAQPIVPVLSDVEGGLHYEVLVRLLDDDDNLVSPGVFLPAAERFNISGQVDRWVVRATLAWLHDHEKHVEALELCSINLSAQSLSDETFLQDLIASFPEHGIPPGKICFEITETAAITDLRIASQFITALRELGCKFSLDDFGSGLSSFAYLRNLPVDFLKIDGLFVRSIAEDPVNLAMVKSINEIGHVMGKKTIAEFVENEAILARLGEIGVDFAQGYGIGMPAPIDEMA